MTLANVHPRVHIVIVNFNNWPDTLECIQSLEHLDYRPFWVLIVDNGKQESGIPQFGADNVRVVGVGRNLGFAGGVNTGVRIALDEDCEYIWILNNDTVVRPDSLGMLVAAAEKNPDEAYVGSWITFYDRPGTLWFGGGEYRWLTGKIAAKLWESPVPKISSGVLAVRTDWITGCSLLVRRDAVERNGLLDESFFLYREEVEWQLRAAPRRPHALLVRAPLVRHKVGRSTGRSDGYLGTVFMSRNYLKLMWRYSAVALPLWLLRWAGEYVARPLLKADIRGLSAAIRSVRLLRMPGDRIVEMVTR